MDENKNFEFIVPYKLKEKFTLFKNITLIDLIFILVMSLFAFIILIVNINNYIKLVLLSIVIILTFVLLMEIREDIKLWFYIIKIFKFSTKNHNQDSLDFKNIKLDIIENNIIKYNGYYLSILELKPIDYDILSYNEKERILSEFRRLFFLINNGKFIKIITPINYDKKISEMKKTLEYLKVKNINKAKILKNEIDELIEINENKISQKDTFYLIIYDYKKDLLKEQLDNIFQISSFSNSKLLKDNEIEIFFKYYYQIDEKEKDFKIPNIKETIKNLTINDKKYKILTLTSLTQTLSDAWLYNLFSLDNTICILSFRKKDNISNTINKLDRTLNELKAKTDVKDLKESEKVKLENKINKTELLINDLVNGQEHLHEIELNIIIDENELKQISENINKTLFKISYNNFEQLEKYNKINPLIFDLKTKDRLVLTSSIMGASFFLISDFFQDEKGIFLGFNNHSFVFFDLFRSWSKDPNYKTKDRVNANLTIIGTSGSGKSFLCKKLLLQNSLSNTKIFVLEPENEYFSLVKTLNGKIINLSGKENEKINPFHIYTTLDNTENKVSNYFKLHLEFLEQFFQTLLGLNRNENNFLNEFIKKLYYKFNINENTNLNNLNNTDFPILDDLVILIKDYLSNEKNIDFDDRKDIRNIYLTLKNYAFDGLHSNLWNGHSNINTDNDFVVFNFKELNETSNKRIINSQMSLVINYIQSQINKNYYNNIQNNEDKRVILLIDEAHVFVDEEFPIGLNFLYQTSKRIRKYGGSLIVATQNVKDFSGGSNKVNSKTSAILNNSQYSLILKFKPFDLNYIKEMYENYSGGLNKNELEILSNAEIGNGLLFINEKVKLNIKIKSYQSDFEILERKEIF